ncbi:hypothetical protein B4U80_00039 [Leptotrombidium deliense]|uniref:Uncharacterized protein n=1 Tax=Leptotrombidium deliense TaxID=299467 RepID=A0A443Q8B1_9ACAR|nr:hypothetical protein B4U80_00039 [Leptotrombidium deliense]
MIDSNNQITPEKLNELEDYVCKDDEDTAISVKHVTLLMVREKLRVQRCQT